MWTDCANSMHSGSKPFTHEWSLHRLLRGSNVADMSKDEREMKSSSLWSCSILVARQIDQDGAFCCCRETAMSHPRSNSLYNLSNRSPVLQTRSLNTWIMSCVISCGWCLLCWIKTEICGSLPHKNNLFYGRRSSCWMTTGPYQFFRSVLRWMASAHVMLVLKTRDKFS